jgi:hypothetical protein
MLFTPRDIIIGNVASRKPRYSDFQYYRHQLKMKMDFGMLFNLGANNTHFQALERKRHFKPHYSYFLRDGIAISGHKNFRFKPSFINQYSKS